MTSRSLLRLFCSCLLGGILGVGSASAETRLIFAGDTHFGENYQESFAANGEGNVLVDEGYPWTIENFSAFLNSADVVIANLETAVTSLRAPVFPSKSYSHYADITLTPQTLAENNIRVVSLANNHALDYGDQGLVETLAALQAQGIASFGAGLDKAQAAAAHIEQFQVDGQDVTLAVIGAYAYRPSYDANYGFYADENSAGAYALWVEDIANQIAQLKRDYPGVFVVFFPHWGSNYDWKTPEQTKVAHDVIDAGADMIIGHGAHMLQEVEFYRERWIIYSLGNLVFLSKGRFASTGAPPYGLAMEMVLGAGGATTNAAFRLYPLFSDNRVTGFQPRFVTENEFDDARSLLLDKPESASWPVNVTAAQNPDGHRYLEFPFDVLPPNANIAATPRLSAAPLPVSFDGSGSTDPGGFVVDWQWDFGDGMTGIGETVNHTYIEPGIYDVTLTVTGSDGSMDTAHARIVATEGGAGSNTDIVINEVLFDPPSGNAGDANGDGIRSSRGDEFIELVNTGLDIVDLGGWTLSQRDNVTIFTFPAGTSIGPGEYVVVFGGVGSAGFRGFAPELQLFAAKPGSATTGFAGDGTSNLQLRRDNVVLRDADGNDIAELAWNSTPLTNVTTDISSITGNINESVTRNPDFSGGFARHEDTGIGLRFSPGTDNLGQRGTPAIQAPVAPIAPIARLAATPETGSAPLTVTLDGSASTDPAGPIVSWQWDFGDGATGSGATVNHTFVDAGTYEVTLTVIGSDGLTDTAETEIVATQDSGVGNNTDIVINEVLFDPPSGDAGDANGDGIRSPRGDEFIELVNTGLGTVDLSGWTLSQRDNVTVFTFPAGISINPGEYVVVFGGVGSAGFNGFPSGLQLFAANPGNENSGFAGLRTSNLQMRRDNVVLRDADGNDIAELVWNNPALTSVAIDITSLSGNINESVTRNPDLTGSYAQHEDTGNGASYSPGTANTGQ